jgi:hypothetical protein
MEDCEKMKFCPKKCMHIRKYDDVNLHGKKIENPYINPVPEHNDKYKISTFTDYVRVPNKNKDIFVIVLLIALLVYLTKA